MSIYKINLTADHVMEFIQESFDKTEIEPLISEINGIFMFINLQMNNTRYSNGSDGKFVSVEVVTNASIEALVLLQKFLQKRKSSCNIDIKQTDMYGFNATFHMSIKNFIFCNLNSPSTIHNIITCF